jgi:hypothetical protein
VEDLAEAGVERAIDGIHCQGAQGRGNEKANIKFHENSYQEVESSQDGWRKNQESARTETSGYGDVYLQ